MSRGAGSRHRAPGGPHGIEVAFGVLLASTSGAAIMAHTFGPVPLRYLAPFVVMPSAGVLMGAVLLGRRNYAGLHLIAGRLMQGALWGLIATAVYDLVRPLLLLALQLEFDPFRAIRVFGSLITNRPERDGIAQAAGWSYHFWNGISFGMMYALVRPRGGVWTGLVWGLTLEGLMMATYPSFLRLRLDNPGFLVTSIAGHGLWGLVLGYGLQRWGHER